MSALVKRPPVVAPWPPTAPGLKPTKVLPGEGLGEVAKRAGMTLKQLLLVNFNIDMDAQRDWAFFVNFYLQDKLRCTRLTPGGNYCFVGGETIYVSSVVKLPTPQPSPDEKKPDLGTLTGVREWFSDVILPARTSGPGNLVGNVGRIIDLVRGRDDGEPNPNGLCGEAVYYLIAKFREATNGAMSDDTQKLIDGKVMGQVTWNGFDQSNPSMTPNHTAVIIAPNVRLKIFNKGLLGFTAQDITPPHGDHAYTYDLLKNCRVLDLYAKTDTTLDVWWEKSAWLDPGRITIDTTPNGRFLEI